MSGFDNDVVYAKNADFTQVDNQDVQESNGLFTDGQMWIGSTTPNAGGTHINVGNLVSDDNSVSITYDSPNISLQASPTMLSVVMMTDTTMTQGTLSDMIYDTVLSDTASGYSAGFYTVPETGIWLLSCEADLVSTAGFVNGAGFITVNPANYKTHTNGTATVSDPNTIVISSSILVPLNQGDVLSVKFFAETIGATDYTAVGYSNGYYNNFTAIRMSA
jgi:hypothetical protein